MEDHTEEAQCRSEDPHTDHYWYLHRVEFRCPGLLSVPQELPFGTFD